MMKESRKNKFHFIGVLLLILSAASAESDSLLVPFSLLALGGFVYYIPEMLEKFYKYLVRREEAKTWK